MKVESKPVEGKLRKESKNKTTMVQEVNWVTVLESKSILSFFFVAKLVGFRPVDLCLVDFCPRSAQHSAECREGERERET